MRAGAPKCAPPSSENATLTAATSSAPVYHATATRVSCAAIAGPLTGHPEISQPSSWTETGPLHVSLFNRTTEISRISASVLSRYATTSDPSPSRAEDVWQQEHVCMSTARSGMRPPPGSNRVALSCIASGLSCRPTFPYARPSSHSRSSDPSGAPFIVTKPCCASDRSLCGTIGADHVAP